MTCQPKMNFSHFSATELGVLFFFSWWVFHIGTIRRESGTSGLEVIFFFTNAF